LFEYIHGRLSFLLLSRARPSRLKLLRFLLVMAVLFARPSFAVESSTPQVLAEYHLALEEGRELFNLMPARQIRRPQLGLALSGGGVRGIAMVGALKAFEEYGMPIDCMAGTSIGAIIGGLYASGYSADEIWSSITRLTINELLNDTPRRATQFLAEKQKRSRAFLQFRLDRLNLHLPEAVTPGQTLTETLTDLLLDAPLHNADFSQLRIPLKIIATDLLSGQKIVLKNGHLIEAMRGSIAIPLLLLPVEYDDFLLVDGGLKDNIPVDETRSMGADIVFALNCSANLRSREEMRAPWEMADQVTTIMQQDHNRRQLERADFSIQFSDFSATSSKIKDIHALYKAGYDRTRELIPALTQRFLQFQQETYAAQPCFTIQKIEISPARELVVENIVDLSVPRKVTEYEIQAEMARLWNSGYLQDVSARIQADGRDTTLVYRLSFNPRLGGIIFYGNTVLPDSFLLKPFAPLLGRPINHLHSKNAFFEIIRKYREFGYSLAEIHRVVYNEASGTAHIYINEGIISSVRFEGHHLTKPFVLNREFTLKAGALFRRDQATTAINNLYGTGLFDAATLLPQPGAQGWNITVRLVEKKHVVARLGARYDDERRGKAFFEIADENVLGSANDLTFHGMLGQRDRSVALQFNANRLFKTYLTSQVTVKQEVNRIYYYEYFNVLGEYERRADGLNMTLGTQIARLGTLTGQMRLEQIHVQSISGSGYDPGDLLINTLGVHSVTDTRDLVPFPKRGKYHTFSYEVSSGKFLGADISYFKVQNQLTAFYTWRRRNTLSPRLFWGTSDLTTPFCEQYRIGGQQTFYGLRDGEWQGRNMILGSLEYVYHIPWKSYLQLYFSMRFDFGSVWKNAVAVTGEDFISGRGAALALKTPLGPVSLAYGRASNGIDRIYFNAGFDF